MIILRGKNINNTRHQKVIYGDVSNLGANTLAAAWLLKQKYNEEDMGWIDKDPVKWRRLVFNTQFMLYMEQQLGPLHCEYCGQRDLKVLMWYHKQGVPKKCTVDHFRPKSLHPHLSEDTMNLFIVCNTCNEKKGDRDDNDESVIAFRYDDSVRSSFVFDESALVSWKKSKNFGKLNLYKNE